MASSLQWLDKMMYRACAPLVWTAAVVLVMAAASQAAPAVSGSAAPGRTLRPQAARRVIEYDAATGRIRIVRGKRARWQGSLATNDSATPAGSTDAIQITAANHRVVSDPEPAVVWGTDDRVPVTSATSFPWRTQAKIFATFPNAVVLECSGTLIAARFAVTAGHCVHSAGNGGWAQRVEVIPGLDHEARPFGSAIATHMRTELGWAKVERPEHDLAVLRLDQPIGDQAGWLGIAAFDDTQLGEANVHVSGYPQDLCEGRCQYAASSPVSSSRRTSIYYGADTSGGSSGSGVYAETGGLHQVIAIHRGTCADRSDLNCGVRITPERAAAIVAWLSE